jgi:hypothetical protein
VDIAQAVLPKLPGVLPERWLAPWELLTVALDAWKRQLLDTTEPLGVTTMPPFGVLAW